MTQGETIPYLSGGRLEGLGIGTMEVVGAIEALIRGREEGSVWAAPKAVILTEDERYMMAAMAAADDPALLAVKTVVMNPRNPERGLAQINGLVTLLNSQTGLPVAVMDGNWITAVRTAGLSAVAAKYMARPEAESAAFVGAGVQARSHLRAFADLWPLKDVRVFGRGRAGIDALCAMAEEMGLEAAVCGSAREAVERADLVVTSVGWAPGRAPFLDADWLKAGAFVTSVDLGAPWMPEGLKAFDIIIVDDLEQERALPNKLAPLELIGGDLSGLVLGKIGGGGSAGERNAFFFRGHALGDIALAALAWQRARGAGAS